MNETIRNFLELLNINYDKFNSLEGSKLQKASDINPILSRFSMFKTKSEYKKISVADIVGYDYHYMDSEPNLLNSLSNYFDRNGDGYHSRSVSMLDIPQEQIMTQLDSSFQKEPMSLMEVDNGIYNISSNGLHRFHVIKTHYLNELSKLNPNDKTGIKNLKEKYSFIANVSEIDYLKSYSAFLLNILDNNLAIELHYNSDYEFTGKICLTDYSKDDEKTILDDNQLKDFVNKKINKFLRTASHSERKQFDEILNRASKYESFQNFYNDMLKQNQSGGFEWN